MMPRRDEDCASDLALDRWLAGELTLDEQRDIEAHVAACAACSAQRGRLAEARRTFAQEAPSFAALQRAEPASRRAAAGGPQRAERYRWLVAASALAAAAVFVAVFQPGPPLPDAEGHGTRTKGGIASLGWVVRRGEHVLEGGPEERLQAGDAVRFTVSAREPVYVAILGLDVRGRASVYHPHADTLVKVEAGADQLLPAAIQFDSAPGEERLYGVFCRSAEPVSRVQAAIERSPDAPQLPQGCSHERWTPNEELP
jgi:hypothetical protein